MTISEDLALADYRDKAYERLHALCGSRNDAVSWADIACLLRERDDLYQQLRAHPKYLTGCLRDGLCRGVCKTADCPNYDLVVAARVCVEPKEDGIKYPSFAERNLIDRFG